MKPICWFVLIIVFAACNQTKPEFPFEKNTAPKDRAADTSFITYLSQFRLKRFPFTFDTDSSFQSDHFYDDSANDHLADSNGRSLTELFLPQPLAEKWLLDTISAQARNEQISWIARCPGIYYDSSFWNTLVPYVRFELPDGHLLLLNIYNQTSGTNGGYTHIFALKYNLTGTLQAIHSLGVYGYYRRVDTEEKKDGGLYWQCAITDTRLHVTMNSLSDIRVTERKTRETEIQDEGRLRGKRDTAYTVFQKLGTSDQVITLE